MPNWNSNSLTIKGKPEEVLMFIQENFITKENPYSSQKGKYEYILSFEKLLPTPKKTNGEIIDEWYEWRNKNWGCKWSPEFDQCNSLTFTLNREEDNIIKSYYNGTSNDNIFNEHLISKYIVMYETQFKDDLYDEAELNSFFETPWCPPEGIINYWSSIYKDTSLEFRCGYYEPGMAFAGEYRINNKDDEDRLVEEYYNSNQGVLYKEYILDEGWETVDYMTENALELLGEINPDMDENMLNLLSTKIKEAIQNAETNKQIATLLDDIEQRWRDVYLSKKEKEQKLIR